MVLDLPHGILSLDDFPFSPQTTMDELLTSGLPVRASSCDYFCATSPVSVDGTDFLPEFSFLAGHLLRLILRPCIEYPASMADQCERQQFRFVVCARWLFVRLGRPTEQPKGENRYIFPWGHISAVADISPRSEHNAGYIVLNYNQTGPGAARKSPGGGCFLAAQMTKSSYSDPWFRAEHEGLGNPQRCCRLLRPWEVRSTWLGLFSSTMAAHWPTASSKTRVPLIFFMSSPP